MLQSALIALELYEKGFNQTESDPGIRAQSEPDGFQVGKAVPMDSATLATFTSDA